MKTFFGSLGLGFISLFHHSTPIAPTQLNIPLASTTAPQAIEMKVASSTLATPTKFRIDLAKSKGFASSTATVTPRLFKVPEPKIVQPVIEEKVVVPVEVKKEVPVVPKPTPVAPAPTSQINYYTNVNGNTIQSPTHYNSAPAGATAECRDGTYSFSQNHRGTCSHHGGVSRWLN